MEYTLQGLASRPRLKILDKKYYMRLAFVCIHGTRTTSVCFSQAHRSVSALSERRTPLYYALARKGIRMLKEGTYSASDSGGRKAAKTSEILRHPIYDISVVRAFHLTIDASAPREEPSRVIALTA